ncbi:hypothetical protein MKX03_005390 [Papaver bracteatum]|nr:hypothetical protein MKX03_005390 [Papaver bracteatum]
MSSSVIEIGSTITQGGSSSRDDHGDHDDQRLESVQMEDLTVYRNLSLPSETFLKSAISLKDQVVEANGRKKGCVDPTVYTGLLGTVFTCLRSYEATGNQNDLLLCSEIVDSCAAFIASTSKSPVALISISHLTFLCGSGGVYELGAVTANYINDLQRRSLFLDHFLQVAQERALPAGPEEGGFGMSYELLYGRAGFLWSALFINKHLGEDTIPKDLLIPIVEAVLAGGRAGALNHTGCPLMYRWHGTRYWGAAHGLAGILQVLLHFPLSADDAEDVKETLRYMMRNRFQQSGNYPVSEGNPRDKLVQWSHGATGMVITLRKAAQVFSRDREFRDAGIEAGEVVWKNGLVRKVGLAGESIYIERAMAFASFLYQNAPKLVGVNQERESEHAYSLFQGLAGTACLWFDIVSPESSRFPCFEL